MSFRDLYVRKYLLVLLPIFYTLSGWSQQKVVIGYVKDALNDERIPFASVAWAHAKTGRLTDSAGNFSFHFTNWPSDTLVVTYVGYQDYKVYIGPPANGQVNDSVKRDTIKVVVRLERGKYATEVVVKRTVDRGLLMWRRIVRRKPYNDMFRFSNFSYELYNKLELDLNRLNFDKLTDV